MDIVNDDKAKAPVLKGQDYGLTDYGYTIPDGYEFVEVRKDFAERSEIVLRKIKIYPTTYEECFKILYPEADEHRLFLQGSYLSPEEISFVEPLIKLRRCRDAYWKIASNWIPVQDAVAWRICILAGNKELMKSTQFVGPCFLEFPNEDMRDEFFHNFKDLIMKCYTLLGVI